MRSPWRDTDAPVTSTSEIANAIQLGRVARGHDTPRILSADSFESRPGPARPRKRKTTRHAPIAEERSTPPKHLTPTEALESCAERPAGRERPRAGRKVLERAPAPAELPRLARLPARVDEVRERHRAGEEQRRRLVAHDEERQQPQRVPREHVRAEQQRRDHHRRGRRDRLRAPPAEPQRERERQERAAADRGRVAAQERRERSEQRLVEAPELGVLREAQQHGLAGALVQVEQDQRGAGGGGGDDVPGAVAAGPRGRHEAGQVLRQEARAGRERREQRTIEIERQECERQPQHAEGLVVAAAGDLHERERAPGEDQQPLEGQPRDAGAVARAAPSVSELAQHQERLHRREGVVDRDDRPRREHEQRRVDRGVVLVVEARVDLVAQWHPARRFGPVAPAVGIAAVLLHAPLPHVAVDVVAQERRRGDEHARARRGRRARHARSPRRDTPRDAMSATR